MIQSGPLDPESGCKALQREQGPMIPASAGLRCIAPAASDPKQLLEHSRCASATSLKQLLIPPHTFAPQKQQCSNDRTSIACQSLQDPRPILFSGHGIILAIRTRCAQPPTAGGYAAGGVAKPLGFTPKASSFFAYESLRLAALAAVSVAACMALGPLWAAAWISPNLCAASASARLNVAMSSAWARDGFTATPISIDVVILKF